MNVPTRCQWESLAAAERWAAWPTISLETDPLPAIEEPPDENKPIVPDGFDPDATEPPDEDEVELADYDEDDARQARSHNRNCDFECFC